VALKTVPQSLPFRPLDGMHHPGWLHASVGMREHFVAA
jgi:hypothetical protein